jgi:hypothetical protein
MQHKKSDDVQLSLTDAFTAASLGGKVKEAPKSRLRRFSSR